MIKTILNRLNTPSLSWIQIEVSSWCNAKCFYCPRTILSDIWSNRHLSVDLFKTLFPVFSKTGMIFLQGWGEPFMHPHIFDMIAMAKKSGCRVGTTTNGSLLDRDAIRRLVKSRLDILCFSLAGTDNANDQIRQRTSFNQVMETIQLVHDVKQETSSCRPRIHIAYLLLQSGLQKIDQLPEIVKEKGISEVVVSTLDFVPATRLCHEAIRPATEKDYHDICHRLEGIRKPAG